MSNTKDLLAAQTKCIEDWNQVKSNFDKTTEPARRTSRYIQGKLDQISAIAEKFNETHRTLEVSLDHDNMYFRQADKFMADHDQFTVQLKALLDTLKPVIPDQLKTALKIQDKRLEQCTQALIKANNAVNEQQPLDILLFYKATVQKLWEKVREQDEIITIHTEPEFERLNYHSKNMFQSMKTNYDEVMEKLVIQESHLKAAKDNQSNLPKLKIPIFTGDYTRWPAFIEIFKRLIHENPSMSDTQKLEYLKTTLEKEPSTLIQHLAISGENYTTALSVLENRYGNQRRIANLHLDKMLSADLMSPKQILDTSRECVEALKNMKLNTIDTFIVYLMTKKMHPDTRMYFEQHLKHPNEMPSLNEFFEFLETRYQALEAIPTKSYAENRKMFTKPNPYVRNHVAQIRRKCGICRGEHRLVECPSFIKSSVAGRRKTVLEQNLCFNCLNYGHSRPKCQSKLTCRKCSKQHHTMLHPENNERKQDNEVTKHDVKTHCAKDSSTVLLATAIVKIKAKNGEYHFLRALVDPGSQASFITEHAAQLLQLPKEKVVTTISGLSEQTAGKSSSRISCEIRPRFASIFKTSIKAIIMKKLTGVLPEKSVTNDCTTKFKDLILADPKYHQSEKIDLLLGAEIYAQIIQNDVIKGQPTAQKTSLGWIIFGETSCNPIRNVLSLALKTSLDQQLQKFWEQEDTADHSTVCLSEEDKRCEQLYADTVTRSSDGRYIVKLPFQPDKLTNLGESRQKAFAMLLSMERKFEKDPILKQEYTKFMDEYLSLGHMTEVPDDTMIKYFIPHHAVFKPDSTTTKLRVVFNASAKTTTGTSLNDCMLIGPKIQANIFDIMLRWRMYPIVFTADVEKMYRQIQIDEHDRWYHGILWRENPSKPVKHIILNTVTYGTASASFASVRTLHQLAVDEFDEVISDKITQDFYVDDFISGAYTLQEAQDIIKRMQATMAKGQFHLRKWTSNDKKALQNLSEEDIDQRTFEIDQGQTVKALGIHWSPKEDNFTFKVKLSPLKKFTKRTLVSDIAKLFDPMGWITPIILVGKMLLQKTWKLQCGWDEELPEDLKNEWLNYRTNLADIEHILIPRWMKYDKDDKIQIHGFGDSSMYGYGAAIYLRIEKPNGDIVVQLLTAKTRIAPVKQLITLPKLELCAAVLTAELYTIVKKALNIKAEFFAWTDSSITLAWIQNEPSKWKTFVANRVTRIHQLTDQQSWRHVISKDNPADIASRGCNAKELSESKLWWTGPDWLKLPQSEWPKTKFSQTTEESKMVHVVTKLEEPSIFTKYSSYLKLVRVVAYMKRFVSYSLKKIKTNKKQSLSGLEITESSNTLLRMAQREMYAEEITALQTNQPIKKSSSLITLTPFLDQIGLLRVGGRLQNSALTYSEKHPILLKGNHPFTKLLIQFVHIKILHGGNQATLAYLRQRYCISKAKQIIKATIRKCTTCVRYKGETLHQLMGNLPAHRVQPSRPFFATGIDFCGPFHIRMSRGRGCKSYKGYVCIFVCMASKAIHLEVVGSLTSEDFINALKRFMSRRGYCKHIYSDNGTNFVGADRILRKEYTTAIKQATTEAAELLANDQITWHFNIPAMSHAGGLWERNVGSVKFHLKRVAGNSTFTFEELSTLLSEIEACLNSRPLCRLREDHGEVILTPAKLLIGEDLLTLPEQPLLDEHISDTRRYQLIQQRKQQFWRIWSNEYLQSLQRRYKWQREQENIKQGEIVLIKDELIPPAKWLMGIVDEVFPGKDGKVRSAQVKTSKTVLKRPINKLIVLPGEDNASALNENVDNNQVSTDDMKMESTKISTYTTITQHRNKKQYTTNWIWLIATILTLFTMYATASEHSRTKNYKLTNFELQPGIYFEHIGEGNLVVSNWKLITYLDLASYWNDLHTIEAHLSQAKEFCEGDLKMSFTCQTSITRMNKLVKNLKKQNTLLLSSNPRSRRQVNWGSIVNTVIDAGSHLLGILDKQQATDYNRDIDMIKTNQGRLKELIENRISVTDSTMNILKQDFSDFRNEINQLRSLSQTMANEVAISVKEHPLFAIINHLNLAINEYQNTQENLIDILMSAFNGNIHVSILLLDQLKAELIKIRGNLPKLTILPAQLNEDGLLHYLKWIKTRARIVDNRMIIELKIPLLYNSEFQIFKLVSIPTLIDDGNMAYIKPTSDYLMTTLERDKYYPLDQDEFNQCQKVSGFNFWCSSHHPIYSVAASFKSCEIKLLQHNQLLPSTCKIKTVPADNYFTKMHHQNSWIFSVEKPRSVDIICNSLQTISLNGSGILELGPGCIMRDPELTLIAKATPRSTFLESSVLPLIDLNSQIKEFIHQSGRSPLINDYLEVQPNYDLTYLWIAVTVVIIINIVVISYIIFLHIVQKCNLRAAQPVIDSIGISKEDDSLPHELVQQSTTMVQQDT